MVTTTRRAGLRGPGALPGLARRILDRADRLLGFVDRCSLAICCLMAAAFVGVVVGSVVFRYALNSSLLWGEELARYLALWLVLLGLGCAHRRSAHVALEPALRRIRLIGPDGARRIGEVLTFALSLAIAVIGWESTMANFDRGQTSAAMQIPIGWAYLAIPVGFGLMAAQSLLRVFAPSVRPVDAETTGPAPAEEGR